MAHFLQFAVKVPGEAKAGAAPHPMVYVVLKAIFLALRHFSTTRVAQMQDFGQILISDR